MGPKRRFKKKKKAIKVIYKITRMLPPGQVKFIFTTSEPIFRNGKIFEMIPYQKQI